MIKEGTLLDKDVLDAGVLNKGKSLQDYISFVITRFVETEERNWRKKKAADANGTKSDKGLDTINNGELMFKSKSRNYFYFFLQRKDTTRLVMKKFSSLDLYDILAQFCPALIQYLESLLVKNIENQFNKKLAIMSLFFKNRYNPKLSDAVKKNYEAFAEFAEDLREDRLDLEDDDIDPVYKKLVLKFKNEVLACTSIDSATG